MKLNELVDDIKAKGAYSKRRAGAVAEHGRKVVAAGLDAAQSVAAVAVKNLKATAGAQKAAITDSKLPVKQRLQKLKAYTGNALADAKAEVSEAARAGYRTVSDKLLRVADVTHKEQALENKIRRKAGKAKKTAQRLAQA